MNTDYLYQSLIVNVYIHGDELETRNHRVISAFDLPTMTFTKTPLVTIRKTAWKKALREMQWFMSGDERCPDEVLDWWDGQLSNDQCYYDGYSTQLRKAPSSLKVSLTFDQVEYVLNGLRHNPYSRRLIMTTWNPYDMAHITKVNRNPNTPTTCHASFIQYFVRNGTLHGKHYQRSADLLLGLPHNFIQHWSLLLYFATHANLKVGSLLYTIGDGHLYCDPSHQHIVDQIRHLTIDFTNERSLKLVYEPTTTGNVPEYKASDFRMEGKVPEPVIKGRPVRF
jgi:thymidylate synthase